MIESAINWFFGGNNAGLTAFMLIVLGVLFVGILLFDWLDKYMEARER